VENRKRQGRRERIGAIFSTKRPRSEVSPDNSPKAGAAMKRPTRYRQGQTIPRCGARLPDGENCREPPALHPSYDPRWRDQYHPSGRCARHGGSSTGPRTPEGKAAVSAAARLAWEEAHRAEGKRRPPETLRARVAAFLEATTWQEAMEITGLSRRQLERLEDGRFCASDEIAGVTAALRDPAALVKEIRAMRRSRTVGES
jgi:hypothetical protein